MWPEHLLHHRHRGAGEDDHQPLVPNPVLPDGRHDVGEVRPRRAQPRCLVDDQQQRRGLGQPDGQPQRALPVTEHLRNEVTHLLLELLPQPLGESAKLPFLAVLPGGGEIDRPLALREVSQQIRLADAAPPPHHDELRLPRRCPGPRLLELAQLPLPPDDPHRPIVLQTICSTNCLYRSGQPGPPLPAAEPGPSGWAAAPAGHPAAMPSSGVHRYPIGVAPRNISCPPRLSTRAASGTHRSGSHSWHGPYSEIARSNEASGARTSGWPAHGAPSPCLAAVYGGPERQLEADHPAGRDTHSRRRPARGRGVYQAG